MFVIDGCFGSSSVQPLYIKVGERGGSLTSCFRTLCEELDKGKTAVVRVGRGCGQTHWITSVYCPRTTRKSGSLQGVSYLIGRLRGDFVEAG